MDIAYEYLLINRVFILSWGNFKLLETFRLKIQNSKNYTHGKNVWEKGDNINKNIIGVSATKKLSAEKISAEEWDQH